MAEMLGEVISKKWWVLLLRGLAAIAFGLMAFAWPGITLASLVLLWGFWALADGIVALFGGVSDKWWVSALIGLAGVAAGICTFLVPGITAVVLLYFIAGWAVVHGVMEIVAAIALRKVITGEWFLILAGTLSVLFGFLLFANPAAGALAVVWMIGAYAVAFGILLAALSFRVKGWGGRARSVAA